MPDRLLDLEGKVVWAAQYEAWGEVRKLSVNEVDQPLRLQGQFYDEETGLYYTRFRYYAPKLGSFISQDPLGLDAGENIYSYAANAQTWADPLGLACERVVNGTKIYGKGQRTGPGHAQLSELLANKLAMTGKFKSIHLNRSYYAATGTTTSPRRSPDILAIDHNNRVHSIEIASRADMSSSTTFSNLTSRNNAAISQLPANMQGGNVIAIQHPYNATTTKSTIDNWLNNL